MCKLRLIILILTLLPLICSGEDNRFQSSKSAGIDNEIYSSELKKCRQKLFKKTVYSGEGSAFGHLFKTLSKLLVVDPNNKNKVLFRGEMNLLDYDLLERTLKEENVPSKLLLDLFVINKSDESFASCAHKPQQFDEIFSNGIDRNILKRLVFYLKCVLGGLIDLILYLLSLLYDLIMWFYLDMMFMNFWHGLDLIAQCLSYYTAAITSWFSKDDTDFTKYRFSKYHMDYSFMTFLKVACWFYFCFTSVYFFVQSDMIQSSENNFIIFITFFGTFMLFFLFVIPIIVSKK